MAGIGDPKTGGRKKGTANKVTQSLAEQCENMGINPWSRLIDKMNDPDDQISLKATIEACSYLYPKRKALEITDERDIKLAEKAKELRDMPKEEKIKFISEKLKLIKGA